MKPSEHKTVQDRILEYAEALPCSSIQKVSLIRR